MPYRRASTNSKRCGKEVAASNHSNKSAPGPFNWFINFPPIFLECRVLTQRESLVRFAGWPLPQLAWPQTALSDSLKPMTPK
jgi:hypothetical protein